MRLLQSLPSLHASRPGSLHLTVRVGSNGDVACLVQRWFPASHGLAGPGPPGAAAPLPRPVQRPGPAGRHGAWAHPSRVAMLVGLLAGNPPKAASPLPRPRAYRVHDLPLLGFRLLGSLTDLARTQECRLPAARESLQPPRGILPPSLPQSFSPVLAPVEGCSD
jgi:hypothetical protein